MADALRHERRATPRISALGSSGMDRARLRPGRMAHVVDLSAGGALIETDWRLLPGTRVELQFGPPAAQLNVAGTNSALSCRVARPGANPVSRSARVRKAVVVRGTYDPLGSAGPVTG